MPRLKVCANFDPQGASVAQLERLTLSKFFGSMLRLRSKGEEEEGDLWRGVLERSLESREVVLGDE